MRRIIYCTFFLLLIACSSINNNEYTYTNFKKELNIEGVRIGVQKIFLKPMNISITDSLMIIEDDATEKPVHIIDMKGFKVLSSYGSKGRGPHEFIFPEISKRINDGKIVINNKGKFYSASFDIDSMISVKNYFPSNKIVYPPSVIIPYNILYLNDTNIVGATSSGVSRLFNYNHRTRKMIFESQKIKFEGFKRAHIKDLGQIYYSMSDYNKNRNKIITAMRFFDRIDILNTRLLIEKSMIRKHSEDATYHLRRKGEIIRDNTMFYYIDIYTTNKYIYALYCGKNLKEAVPNVGNEIHVFSWDGKPLYKININIGLSKIVVLNDNTKLYGLDTYDKQPIIQYDINL